MRGSRQKYLDRELKLHDSLLSVEETKLGRLDIYRKSSFGCNPPHFIFSLTDNWLPTGRPVEWGVDVVINRIKAHDLWRNETIVDTIEKELEADEKARERHLKNSIEDFMGDFQRQFAKATDGINTGTLDKNVPLVQR